MKVVSPPRDCNCDDRIKPQGRRDEVMSEPGKQGGMAFFRITNTGVSAYLLGKPKGAINGSIWYKAARPGFVKIARDEHEFATSTIPNTASNLYSLESPAPLSSIIRSVSFTYR